MCVHHPLHSIRFHRSTSAVCTCDSMFPVTKFVKLQMLHLVWNPTRGSFLVSSNEKGGKVMDRLKKKYIKTLLVRHCIYYNGQIIIPLLEMSYFILTLTDLKGPMHTISPLDSCALYGHQQTGAGTSSVASGVASTEHPLSKTSVWRDHLRFVDNVKWGSENIISQATVGIFPSSFLSCTLQCRATTLAGCVIISIQPCPFAAICCVYWQWQEGGGHWFQRKKQRAAEQHTQMMFDVTFQSRF